MSINGTNTLTLGANAVVNMNNTSIRLTSDRFLAGDGTIINDAMIVADGTLGVPSRSIDPDEFINNAVITSQNGAFLAINAAVVTNGANAQYLIDNATIAIGAGNGTLDMVAGSFIGGAGTLDADINLAGTLAPGTSAGILNVDGNLDAAGTALFQFEIGGTVTGEFDQLDVDGTLDLDGVLELSLINGFTPDLDAVFILAMSDVLSGQFQNVLSGELLGGTQFTIFYGVGSPFDPNSVVAQNIPLPPALGLLVLGLAGLGLIRFQSPRASGSIYPSRLLSIHRGAPC